MFLLGYDIGSSSVKASLVDAETGKCIATAFYPEKEAPIISKQPGWAEQDPSMWLGNLKLATADVLHQLGEAGYSAGEVKAIGISYQMHGLVCVDKDMNVLRPSIIWCDSRAVPYGNAAAEALFEKLWKQYPNKRGKGKVSAAKKRALLEIGEEQMLRALQRYIDEHEAKERQGGFVPAWKNGDTFFNTDYIDYLDENYVAAPREPPRPAATCSGFVNYEQSNTDWEAAFEQILRLQDEEARKSNEDSESQIPAS